MRSDRKSDIQCDTHGDIHGDVHDDVLLWQREGDAAARDRVIGATRGLAFHYAQKNPARHMEVADMEQHLLITLVECLNHYDPDSEARFTTYLTSALAREARRRRLESRLIFVNRHVVSAVWQRDHGQYLTPTAQKIAHLLPEVLPTCVPLEEPESGEASEGSANRSANLAHWHAARTPDFANEAMLQVARVDALAKGVATLRERERQAIGYYHFDGFSRPETAAAMGVSESRVYRLLQSAYAKLRRVGVLAEVAGVATERI